MKDSLRKATLFQLADGIPFGSGVRVAVVSLNGGMKIGDFVSDAPSFLIVWNQVWISTLEKSLIKVRGYDYKMRFSKNVNVFVPLPQLFASSLLHCRSLTLRTRLTYSRLTELSLRFSHSKLLWRLSSSPIIQCMLRFAWLLCVYPGGEFLWS